MIRSSLMLPAAAAAAATMSPLANAQTQQPGSFRAMIIRNATPILKAACDRGDAHCPERTHWVCGLRQRCWCTAC